MTISVKDDVTISSLDDQKRYVAINRNGEESRSQIDKLTVWGR